MFLFWSFKIMCCCENTLFRWTDVQINNVIHVSFSLHNDLQSITIRILYFNWLVFSNQCYHVCSEKNTEIMNHESLLFLQVKIKMNLCMIFMLISTSFSSKYLSQLNDCHARRQKLLIFLNSIKSFTAYWMICDFNAWASLNFLM